MRIASVVAALIVLALPAAASAGASGTAESFVRALQRGDTETAKRALDDPRYRAEPRGGTDAYFVYESGFEPNLAFLVRQPFALGAATETTQRSDWYLLDGTLYATVSIPLTFTEPSRPWMLPAPIAFGHPMPFVDLVKFSLDPARDSRHLTLRIRQRVDPGRLRPPPPRVAPPPPVGPAGAQAVAPRIDATDTYGSMMGQRPVDPAAVRLPAGEALSTEQLQRFLPRLTAITIDISLVRRGRILAPWGVTRWNVRNAVVATEKGEVTVLGAPEKLGQ